MLPPAPHLTLALVPFASADWVPEDNCQPLRLPVAAADTVGLLEVLVVLSELLAEVADPLGTCWWRLRSTHRLAQSGRRHHGMLT
mmetsp:Transcript_49790/g.117076  ORF Transcript_49790/g.117076 Transcript_49790/m.117076 type:complete len:85 (-) Transcript_49790:106-360(-)